MIVRVSHFHLVLIVMIKVEKAIVQLAQMSVHGK